MSNASRFTATIEILKGQGAAIVALFDSTGEWCGASRITTKARTSASLYEAGYNHACQMAAVKGGSLDAYRREGGS